MTTWQDRQREVLLQTAKQAWEQPLLNSGFWTHGDIRNNYYYSTYLVAAVADSGLELPFDRELALAKASSVLTRVLMLQDTDPVSDTYGHWPLGLGEIPDGASKNTLPAEIMGCLLVYFYQRFSSILPDCLCELLDHSIETLYRSTYYRVELKTFGHHEAKYTASKLIFGYRFGDHVLMEVGRNDLNRTMGRVRELGMPEYGALPWFWHWIQAYTCAHECLPKGEVRSLVAELLDELWSYRAIHYLQGAWTGGRMRSLPHDLPKDGNVAFDYVQFGNFQLPYQLPRVEYAGLLFYQAPVKAMKLALRWSGQEPEQQETDTQDTEPRESKWIITPASGPDAPALHSYLYVEKSFAAGGVWERVKEFDNEQHRWEITFPLLRDGSINHLYVFPPGEGYTEGDPRHAGEGGEVLYYRGTIMAIYPPAGNGRDPLVGVLPLGEWVQEDGALYGRVHNVYIALYTPGTIHITKQTDRLAITCMGSPNGIVVDVISDEEVSRQSIGSLTDFVHVMEPRRPMWRMLNESNASNSSSTSIMSNEGVTYETISGDRLQMEIQLENGQPSRMINGLPVDFAAYSISSN